MWLLCASLVALVVLQLYVQFRFNYWNRNFFDELERRDPEDLRVQVLLLEQVLRWRSARFGAA